jgi:hypothetical protein
MNKLRSTGRLIDRNKDHERRVLREEKFDDTTRKSLKRLAQETEVFSPVQEKQSIGEA